jgi:hypothetical protein
MKELTLVLGAAIAATTSSHLQAMPIQPLSEASPMVLQAADGCGGGRYRGPGGAGHWCGRGPYPGGYYGPYHRPYRLMRDRDQDPGTAAATDGIAVQAAPVIRLGEARTQADITAPIDTDGTVENLRQVAFQAAMRRFSAFSASASASRLVAKDISDRSWAWPERKSVQR